MRKLSLVGLMVAIIFTACKKGDTGAAGAAGATGPAGATGAAGPKGDTGVANVIYSQWLDVTFNLATDSSAYIGLINAPLLTDSMLAKGEIKVYANFFNSDSMEVHPLPYQQFDNNGLNQFSLNPFFITGTIGISSNSDVSTYTDYGKKFLQYRYVLIPGGVLGGRVAAINWNDYAAVAAYLHWKN